MTTTNCLQCGAELRPEAKFCGACGRETPPLKPDRVAQTPTRNLADMPTAVSPIIMPGTPNRDRAAQTRTRTLSPPSIFFEPLPEGALLPVDNPRYHVIRQESSGPTLNVYIIETLEPTQVCPNLQCPQYETSGKFCSRCGQLASASLYLQYHLEESPTATPVFASLDLIQNRQISHEGFWFYSFFTDISTNGTPRFYVLKPEPGPTLAIATGNRPETAQLLEYSVQLAESLAYLHGQKLVWRHMDANNIALEDKVARWINFNLDEASTDEHYQRDTQNLARLLFTLATDLPQYTSAHRLPAAIGRLFDQALGQTPTLTTAAGLSAAFQTALAEARHPLNTQVSSYAQTDVGRVRDHNEDSLLAQQLIWSNKGADYPIGLYAVADGMGGHSAGEVASGEVIAQLVQKMAAEIIPRYPHQLDDLEPENWLKTTIQSANKAVFERAKQSNNDMGTTVVAVLLLGRTAYIGHVGDSRAYLLNEAEIRSLTTDHSMVERLVATNQITAAEARNHPQRNVIYRTIGDKANVEVDIAGHPLAPDDCLLLCSDGLSGLVTDQQLHDIYRRSPAALSTVARSMIGTANLAGGDDNITVILVKIEADQS